MTDNLPAAISMAEMERLAQAVAKSRLFGITTPEQALTLMSIAQAEGRHPALAARDYHIIQGAPAKKAEAMLRDFLSAGGRVEWHELTDAAADATFSHPAGGSARIRWDKARVDQAQLGGNAMHKKYPRQMLRSRVVSEGVRTVWPMATSGMYVPEEVADFGRSKPEQETAVRQLEDFAKAGEVVDHETGEVAAPSNAELFSGAHTVAERGTEAFRSWWKTITPEQREILRPGMAGYQKIAAKADARADDPFGLPPLTEQAPAREAPERPSAGETRPAPAEGRESEPSGWLLDLEDQMTEPQR